MTNKAEMFFFGNREKGSEMLLHAHNFILCLRKNCDQYKAIIERTHTESISCAIHISQRNFMEGTYAHCSNTSSSLAPSSIRWSVQVVNNTIKWHIVNSIKSYEIGLCYGIFVVRRKSRAESIFSLKFPWIVCHHRHHRYCYRYRHQRHRHHR